jgi:hypothetical protein
MFSMMFPGAETESTLPKTTYKEGTQERERKRNKGTRNQRTLIHP